MNMIQWIKKIEAKVNKNILLFDGILLLLFLGLKLTNQIDWSWWWVTVPLWIIVINLILILDDEVNNEKN